MDKAQIIAGKNEIISRYGAWTSHDIYLGQGISTLNKNTNCLDYGSRGYLQLLKHYGYTDLTDCKVLDLGCLEGVYTIELAQLGANVYSISSPSSLSGYTTARVAVDESSPSFGATVYACFAAYFIQLKLDGFDPRTDALDAAVQFIQIYDDKINN